MPRISAQTAKIILFGLNAPGAVLLRGVDSILRGENQNDIDVFIPKLIWDKGRVFGTDNIIRTSGTGWPQTKISLLVPETGETADIDVFHALTWRGLELAYVSALPTRWVPEVGVSCLTREAEVWLTVLKNTVHDSPTRSVKLLGVVGDPVFPLASQRSDRLGAAIERCITQNVWTVARSGQRDWRKTCRARTCIFLLQISERPLATLIGISRWLAWRLFRQSDR